MPRFGRSSRSLIKPLVLASLLGLSGLADAQTVPYGVPFRDDALLAACQASLPCRTHLDKAMQLYKQDRYSAALDEYQAAYVLQPYPLILFNIARIYHKQGEYSDAAAYYQRYLDTGHVERAQRARELLLDAQEGLAKKESGPAAQTQPQVQPQVETSVPLPAVRTLLPVAAASPVPAARSRTPLHRKAWLWAILGVTVIGAATGLGIGLYARGPDVSGLPARSLSFGD